MVIVRIWEGLGNQLFQYAYARALELRTKQKVYFDVDRCFISELEGKRTKRSFQLDNFQVKLQKYDNVEKKYFYLKQGNIFEKSIFLLAQHKLFPFKFYKEENVCYNNKLKKISGNCYLMGWFQNEKYFKEYRNVLLKELIPKRKIKISLELKRILREENTVSVHIRRGDYVKDKNVLPFSYYKKAIEYIKSNVEKPVFLIFSDDIDWVKKYMQLEKGVIYISDKEILEDYEELLLISKCKHNIIANSTFSWWGAWLNTNKKKIVIGPQNWFGLRGKNVNFNIMPLEWIRI